MAQTVDLGQFVDRQKLSWFHISLIIWCGLVTLADGYDIQAAAFAAPALIKEWHLDKASLGPLFSAGLFAGLFGPPFFGYLADRFGRRLSVIAGTLCFGVFSLASVAAASLPQLILLRFLAGLGMSGALALTTALTNEFAPRRVRATFVILMFSGTTFGGGVPGFVAGGLMPVYGWQILFWIGGLVPIAIAVCLCFALPESPKFLALRPHRRAELAALMARMEPGVKLAADASFVIQEEENRGGISLRKLFVGRLAVLSPLLWCCVFICMMVFYFASSWLPTLLATSGVPIERAALATTLFQFGGTLGGWSIMRPMDKYGMIPCTILYVLTIPIIACLGLAGNSETLVLALSAAAGFCLLGLNFGQISASSNIYPTSIRANGVGWFFFFARMGGMCGPLAAGLLIGWHVSTSSLFYLAAVPLAVGSVASVLVTRLYWLHYERPSREEVMAGTVAVAAKAID